MQTRIVRIRFEVGSHSITIFLGFFVAFVVGFHFFDFLSRISFEDAVVRRIVLMIHTILVSLIFKTTQ